jgi:hypothetical protein
LPVASDVTIPVSTTWNITFAGVTFALSYNTISVPTDSYVWGTGDVNHSSDGEFLIHDIDGSGAAAAGGVSALKGLLEGGTVSFAAVATPEPSSVALMLLGVGLVFVMRKRIGQRLPQAS